MQALVNFYQSVWYPLVGILALVFGGILTIAGAVGIMSSSRIDRDRAIAVSGIILTVLGVSCFGLFPRLVEMFV